MAYRYKLTKKGKAKVSHFLKECRAFKKELLDGRKDTADGTELPTEDGILEDIEEWIDEDGAYYNAWGVTDNHDMAISLQEGEDFIGEDDLLEDFTQTLLERV